MTEVERIAAELAATDGYARALNAISDGMRRAVESANPAFFTGTVSPHATAAAARLAETAAESLTRQLTESQLRAMGDTLAKGLAEGKRPVDLYNKLQEVKSLDSGRARRYQKAVDYLEQSGLSDAQVQRAAEREYNRLLQDRRRTIAQTEGRYATSGARYIEADARGDKYKMWITAQDDRVSDLCAGNEAAGVIPIGDQFPGGQRATPGHPRCRCSVAYMKTERQRDYFQKRQEERIAETEEARGEA